MRIPKKKTSGSVVVKGSINILVNMWPRYASGWNADQILKYIVRDAINSRYLDIEIESTDIQIQGVFTHHGELMIDYVIYWPTTMAPLSEYIIIEHDKVFPTYDPERDAGNR